MFMHSSFCLQGMATEETFSAAANVPGAAHTVTSPAHKCCGQRGQNAIHIIFATILFIGVVTDTVEVIKFSPVRKADEDVVQVMRIIWTVGVALSWLIFIYDIFVIIFSVRSNNQSKTIAKLFVAHTVVVILIEEIMTTLASFVLVMVGVLPISQLYNVPTLVSASTTSVATLFQHPWFCYKAVILVICKKKSCPRAAPYFYWVHFYNIFDFCCVEFGPS